MAGIKQVLEEHDLLRNMRKFCTLDETCADGETGNHRQLLQKGLIPARTTGMPTARAQISTGHAAGLRAHTPLYCQETSVPASARRGNRLPLG